VQSGCLHFFLDVLRLLEHSSLKECFPEQVDEIAHIFPTAEQIQADEINLRRTQCAQARKPKKDCPVNLTDTNNKHLTSLLIKAGAMG
jgi:hypothetical protein